MSLGIKCSTVGRGEWGFLEQYRVVFPVRGGGWGLGSGLFLWARHGSCKDVVVPSEGHGARLKKKMGLGLLARRSGYGGYGVVGLGLVGLVNRIRVVNHG